MAPILETVFALEPYHLLAWGTLMGMELYQSQVMTALCYRHLPTPQFTQLQKRVFPAYFSLQTGLTVLLIATYPPLSVYSLFTASAPSLPVWSAIVPLTLNLSMAGLNWTVYGPRTSELMTLRAHQETVDGRKAGDNKTSVSHGGKEQQSDDMRRLKKAFSRAHAMAIHLNAIAMISTVWYGFGLASRMRFAS